MAEAPLNSSFSVLYERYESKFGKNFIDAVKFSLAKCNNNIVPKFEQIQAIYQVTRGKDVFVNLSMGFGKSLIYSLFAFVCDYMRSAAGKVCESSIVVLISPLVSLMDDQLSQMSTQGISAVKLTDLTDTELNALKVSCKHKILIVSPEGFQSQAISSILKHLKDNIMCIAVDEAHCIEQCLSAFLQSKLPPIDENKPFIFLTSCSTLRSPGPSAKARWDFLWCNAYFRGQQTGTPDENGFPYGEQIAI
ncbi:hypothetical protein QZH41_007918 [Actinostola sp. cb2023]|nr:hypothetical protein QZH41_007918 [Actinostola sp. cb2023]